MAKSVIARVLDEKTERVRYFTEDCAVTMATGILHDNAVELFKLSTDPSM
jgi:hypothetical protein